MGFLRAKIISYSPNERREVNIYCVYDDGVVAFNSGLQNNYESYGRNSPDTNDYGSWGINTFGKVFRENGVRWSSCVYYSSPGLNYNGVCFVIDSGVLNYTAWDVGVVSYGQ